VLTNEAMGMNAVTERHRTFLDKLFHTMLKEITRMNQLLKVYVLCFGLFILCCFIANLIGHQQEDKKFFSDLWWCDNSLCYKGITPGVTLWDDGEKLLQHDPQLSVIDNSSGMVFHNSLSAYSVGVLAASNAVREINIAFRYPSIRTGEILNEYGSPCYVTLIGSNMTLHYSNATFLVLSAGYSLLPTFYIARIVLKPPNETFCTKLGQATVNTLNKWRGFRTYVEPK
jgi:hypothetical protein